MMEKVRVLMADDHPIAREGIKKIIVKASDIQIVGEAVDGEQALQMAEELRPDVLLLDMEMPGMKGLEVAKRLKESNASVSILALSTYDTKQYIFGLLASGAAGYLTKEEIPETIVDAIRGVAQGERGWVSRKVAAILSNWKADTDGVSQQLTNRESDILRQVVQGKTNQEISFDLGISQKTVEKHLVSVYSKLKVSSRVEAAVLAVKDDLV